MIKDYLFRIFRPRFWIQIYPTSDALSKRIEAAIDSQATVTTRGCSAVMIDGMELWTANYPYAYGEPMNFETGVLPSARVRKKLHNYIIERANKEITND